MTGKRKGVQRPAPTLTYERRWMRTGHQWIAGVDEAGRGAWAGPVVAGAVILNPADVEALRTVNDSKQLSPCQRAELYPAIIQYCIAHGLGQASAEEIDAIGIVPATRLA